MTTTTKTIEQFAKDNGITLKAKKTDRNPNMADSANMDNWKGTGSIKRTGNPWSQRFKCP